MMLKQLYMLADNLQMELKRTGKSIQGERSVSVRFGDLALFGTQRVIASYVHDGGGSLVAELFGDLGLLVSVEGAAVHCAVLDLGLAGPLRGVSVLDKAKPKTVADAEAAVGAAIKARFVRKGLAAWRSVEA